MLPTFSTALSVAMLAILSARDGTIPCQPNRPSLEMHGTTCMRRGRKGHSVRSPGSRVPWNWSGWNSMSTPDQFVR
jgi:hypothetical protein